MLTASLVAAAAAAAAIAAPPAPAESFDPIVFELVKASGIDFVTNSGRSEHRHQPETMVAGIALFDYDNDGRLDVFLTNGARMPDLDKSEPVYWNRLYHNLGNWKFEDVTEKAGLKGHGFNLVLANLGRFRFADATPTAGAEFAGKRAVHRGAAFGDLDGDGKVDAIVTALDEGVEVWRNVSPVANHWLEVKTVATRSNRDGMGAEIAVTSASGVRHGHVNTSVGYGCASDARVHFGLGKDDKVTKLEVRWPSGTLQVLEDVAVDRVLVVKEPEK
jgi:ASPIC/UnbV protein